MFYILLNFVFNFGSLNKIDERKYINNMVIKPITNLFFNEIKKNIPAVTGNFVEVPVMVNE